MPADLLSGPRPAGLSRRKLLLTGALLAAGGLASCGRTVAASPQEAGILAGVQLGIPFPRGSGVPTLGQRGIGYCFGAKQLIPGVQASYVLGAYRDYYNHDLAWFQHNHPDWVLYHQDRKTLAGVGDPDANGEIVMDISNPAVQEYQFQILKGFLDAGWTRVGFDNVGVNNPASWGGIYRNGQWVQLYSGQYYGKDILQTWLTWARALRSKIKAYKPSAQFDANFSVPKGAPQDFSLMLPYFDGYFDEQGYTNAGGGFASDNQWLDIYHGQQLMRAQGKLVLLNGLIPVKNTLGFVINSTNVSAVGPELESAVTAQQVLWVVGNYLLVKGKDYFTWASVYFDGFQDYGHYIYHPEYFLPIGSPLDEPRQWKGVYRRDYSGGMVLVNPSSKDSVQVDVSPFWRPLHDASGHKVTSLTMAPVSATVLTTTVPHVAAASSSTAFVNPVQAMLSSAAAAKAKSGTIP